MKTIFIMGILSFFCGISAAQPQYWGEGAYDLENVVFGMNVDKYYSKARLYDGDYDESFRYFMKKKVKCKTQEGKKAVIQEYSSVETNYGEVLARFGKFEFPYTGMVADKSGKLIGILAQEGWTERRQSIRCYMPLQESTVPNALSQKSISDIGIMDGM